MTKELKAKGSF